MSTALSRGRGLALSSAASDGIGMFFYSLLLMGVNQGSSVLLFKDMMWKRARTDVVTTLTYCFMSLLSAQEVESHQHVNSKVLGVE